MNDEPRLDLQLLDPEETPEVVRGAIRRFRWRVVLATVAGTVVVASSIGWGMGTYLRHRDAAELLARVEPAKHAIMEDVTGGFMCSTPTFELGSHEVVVLRAVPMPEAGWALHLVVHGSELSNGVGRFANVVPVGAGGPKAVEAQPGATWANAYVAIPRELGDRFGLELWDVRNEVVGRFTVDIATLRCDFS